jgi:hypothetical protein
LQTISGWTSLLAGCRPIEQANDLPQFHACRHHPVSFCNEKPQEVLPVDSSCVLGLALALSLDVDNERFLRSTWTCSALVFALGENDERGLRSTCFCSASTLAPGVENAGVISSVCCAEMTAAFPDDVLSSTLERNSSNVLL